MPYFLQKRNRRRRKSKSKRRKLVGLKNINVARDVLTLKYVFRQDQEPKKFAYGLEMKEWTSNQMKIHIDFNNPLMVSRGNDMDQLVLNIVDRDLFVNSDGDKVQANRTTVVKELPRQVPKGVDAKELKKDAKSSGNAMIAMFIVQIVLSLFLKGSIDLIYSLFLTLQMIVWFSYYNLNLPANAELYLKEIGRIVKFEVLNPDTIIQVWHPNFELQDYLSGDKVIVSSDQQAFMV
jgi:hypothetical protein